MPALSERLSDLTGSPVRAMLEVAQRPDIISFGGGLPASDSFADITLPAHAQEMLQYGPTAGEPALRARIAAELCELGLDAPPERVMVLSGSQQGLDLAAKLVVDRGVGVAVEDPSYLAALQVFRFYGARFETLDRRGPGAGWSRSAWPAMAYVTPTFQNPTGACWSAEERSALAAACDAHDVILVEDDPYRDLAYEPCARRPAAADVKRAAWIYQGSFSKVLAPGLRLGYLAASADLFPYLARLKQAADLHSDRLSQAIALDYLGDAGRGLRMRRLTDAYRARRDAFGAAMGRHLGAFADWEVPKGGLFFWATLRDGRSADALLARALAAGVIFTPGTHFSPTPGGCASALRLNFTHAGERRAEEGLAILGELLADEALAA